MVKSIGARKSSEMAEGEGKARKRKRGPEKKDEGRQIGYQKKKAEKCS